MCTLPLLVILHYTTTVLCCVSLWWDKHALFVSRTLVYSSSETWWHCTTVFYVCIWWISKPCLLCIKWAGCFNPHQRELRKLSLNFSVIVSFTCVPSHELGQKVIITSCCYHGITYMYRCTCKQPIPSPTPSLLCVVCSVGMTLMVMSTLAHTNTQYNVHVHVWCLTSMQVCMQLHVLHITVAALLGRCNYLLDVHRSIL